MTPRKPLGLFAMLLLASCLAAPQQDAPSLLRNPTAPLSIISRGGAEAMQGDWHVRNASPAYANMRALTFHTGTTQQHRIEFQETRCSESAQCETLTDGWMATPLAQNRWQLSSEADDRRMEMWVIWIDDDFRTAAIGSPDSDMAFILDRKSEGGADRINAASDVLAFNGYNMSAFVTR